MYYRDRLGFFVEFVEIITYYSVRSMESVLREFAALLMPLLVGALIFQV